LIGQPIFLTKKSIKKTWGNFGENGVRHELIGEIPNYGEIGESPKEFLENSRISPRSKEDLNYVLVNNRY